ncbi:hypothetical protein, partial [Thiolapillus sp.]|uniref:hypothetical protein n=1 Tax=Thiolapillus sp. TaxID=2017437 RepID=UPI003AF81376
ARRYGRAFSCLTARGGGLPSFNYLKPGISFETLNQVALQISDNEAADQMKKARQKLFNNIHEQTLKTG